MSELPIDQKIIPGKKMIKWGWFLLLAPLIGLVVIFFGWTLVQLINNILSGGVAETATEGDPMGTIIAFIKGLLTLGGLLCTIWGLSLSPIGLVLLVIGYIKKKKKTNTAV